MKLSPEEQQAILQHRKKQRKSRNPLRSIMFLLIGVLGLTVFYWLITQPVPEQTSRTILQTSIAHTPGIPVREENSSEIKKPAAGPNYQATNQVLKEQQDQLNSQMAKATADAEYYHLMLIKSDTEQKIAQNEIQITAAAEAAIAQATQTQTVFDRQNELMALQIAQEQDELQSQREKNDIDVANYQKMKDTVTIMLLVGIAAIIILLFMFIGWILRKASAQQKWIMDQELEKRKQHTSNEIAGTVALMLSAEQKERDLIEKLIRASIKVGRGDDHIVPRFDAIQNYISQPERDQAVKLLVKYKRCEPVQQGKPTRLMGGSFLDLLDDLKSGNFPPTTLANRRVKNLYLQQSTVNNSDQQESTVRKISDGVYIGN